MADQGHDIEKYLRGELTPAEMHALEKRALEDPFLADALEGGGSISHKDFSSDLKSIRQVIAVRRQTNRRVIYLRIAAAMALLIGLSYFVYLFVRLDVPDTMALKKAPKTEETKDKSGPIKAEKETVEPEKIKQQGPPQVATKPKVELQPASDSKTLAGESAAGKGVEEKFEASKPKEVVEELKIAEAPAQVAIDKKDEEPKPARAEMARKKMAQQDAVSSAPAPQRVVTGQITSIGDGSPIPGANIIVQGTQLGAVSDAKGNYQVITNAPDDTLAVSFIGFQTQQVSVPAGKSNVDVSLPADPSQLNEVIVTGYGTSDGLEREPDLSVELAEPVGGRRTYNKYLEKNLLYPKGALQNRIEGRVTVEFTVLPSGKLTGFTIVRGLDFGCNDEVIRLIKEGPDWKPSTRGNTSIQSTVRVRVRFKLPK